MFLTVNICQRTPSVYIWDQTLGSVEKDKALPSAHLLEDCEMILKPVLIASLTVFAQHKPRL